MCRPSLLCFTLTLAMLKATAHSEQDDSGADDRRGDEAPWGHSKKEYPDTTLLPFIKHKKVDDTVPTTIAPVDIKTHPNEKFFPLIYSQLHVDSMFKSGDNWYTWSVEKRTDGSSAVNYYVCYDEPQKCDEAGWERIEAPPKCAIEIDWLLVSDRACVNSYGTAPPRTAIGAGLCDGADQMKVSDLSEMCGPRIRSTWRFVRTRRARPAGAALPTPAADVNTLVCDDAEECLVHVEYRIHHDRITFTIREETKGHIFKSMLTRDSAPSEDRTPPHKTAPAPENRIHHHGRKSETHRKYLHSLIKAKPADTTARGRTQTGRKKSPKQPVEDISEDASE